VVIDFFHLRMRQWMSSAAPLALRGSSLHERQLITVSLLRKCGWADRRGVLTWLLVLRAVLK
jgi:hypothetical protein